MNYAQARDRANSRGWNWPQEKEFLRGAKVELLENMSTKSGISFKKGEILIIVSLSNTESVLEDTERVRMIRCSGFPDCRVIESAWKSIGILAKSAQ